MTRLSQVQNTNYVRLLNRLLIRQGIIELPSAGYLPVTPGAAMTINDQVRQWMGEGVNLRFCVVTPDYVQHALEEAQHMERISLITGLDNPTAKPDVDILVPNGLLVSDTQQPTANLFAANLRLSLEFLSPLMTQLKAPSLAEFPWEVIRNTLNFSGAARANALDSGEAAFYLAGETSKASNSSSSSSPSSSTSLTGSSDQGAALEYAARLSESFKTNRVTVGVFTKGSQVAGQLWATLRCDQNVFSLKTGETTPVFMRMILTAAFDQQLTFDFQLRGDFRLDARKTSTDAGGASTLNGVEGCITALASLGVSSPSGSPNQLHGSPVLSSRLELVKTSSGHSVTLKVKGQSGIAFHFRGGWSDSDPLNVNFHVLEPTFSQADTPPAAEGTLLASPTWPRPITLLTQARPTRFRPSALFSAIQDFPSRHCANFSRRLHPSPTRWM